MPTTTEQANSIELQDILNVYVGKIVSVADQRFAIKGYLSHIGDKFSISIFADGRCTAVVNFFHSDVEAYRIIERSNLLDIRLKEGGTLCGSISNGA